MKLLIIGHGRHGKDTVAEMISSRTGLTCKSSSRAALDLVVFPVIGHDYKNKDACFEDRINRRKEWFNLITDYNKVDPSRLCKCILETSDIYIGMRSKAELEATAHMFDWIIWVDASKRLMPEGLDSCSVTFGHANVVIDNNLDLINLEKNVDKLCQIINNQKDNS